MRDHVERLVMLPFSFGCVSESSVDVGKSNQTSKKHRVSQENLPQTRRTEVKESQSRGRMRNVRVLLALPKAGMQRLIRGFKSFSRLFVYREEVEEDEIEREMEIGLPTDVKHVTHIGWDGSTTINPIKGWENLKAPEIMSFPSISLKEFEHAMTAQTAPAPLGVSTNNALIT